MTLRCFLLGHRWQLMTTSYGYTRVVRADRCGRGCGASRTRKGAWPERPGLLARAARALVVAIANLIALAVTAGAIAWPLWQVVP